MRRQKKAPPDNSSFRKSHSFNLQKGAGKRVLKRNLESRDLSIKGKGKMKKIMILAMLVIVLVMGLRDSGQAKPYRSLSILNPNYTVEIPDDVILPDTSQFELAVPPRHHPQNPEITMFLYQDPNFKYLNETSGEEIFPYLEVTKKEGKARHLTTLAFINEEGQTEVYEDKAASGGPASDRLEKVAIKQKPFRRVPR